MEELEMFEKAILEHEIFYGESEYEIEEQIHRFVDQPWISYEGEETYMEHESSYATVLWYYYLPWQASEV